jgi:hypothetical protein
LLESESGTAGVGAPVAGVSELAIVTLEITDSVDPSRMKPRHERALPRLQKSRRENEDPSFIIP